MVLFRKRRNKKNTCFFSLKQKNSLSDFFLATRLEPPRNPSPLAPRQMGIAGPVVQELAEPGMRCRFGAKSHREKRACCIFLKFFVVLFGDWVGLFKEHVCFLLVFSRDYVGIVFVICFGRTSKVCTSKIYADLLQSIVFEYVETSNSSMNVVFFASACFSSQLFFVCEGAMRLWEFYGSTNVTSTV